MSKRLVRLAKAIALIDVKEEPEGGCFPDGGMSLEQARHQKGELKGKVKDLDLRAEDLANRLEEAVTAIGDCVAILKELGMEGGKAEEKILSVIQGEIQGGEAIPGGLAKGKPDSDFDPAQIEKGIKVELEHTGDREKAREIAKDHLTEIPDYYDRLEKMEEEAEKGDKEQKAVDLGKSPAEHIAKAIDGLGAAERHVGQAMNLLPDNEHGKKERLHRIRRNWTEEIFSLGDFYRELAEENEE
jgi:hypothetical protein